MSTPKAQKFRIRKIVAPFTSVRPKAQGSMPFAPAPEDDGFGDMNLLGKQTAPADPMAGRLASAELAAIRAEGLTAQQLRTARRVAVRNGMDVTDDYDAVLQLRRKNIDPFQRDNILDLKGPGAAESQAPGAAGIDPKSSALEPFKDKKVAQPTAPLPALDDAARRAAAIIEMQRDIVRRRRRNFTMLMMRLAFFVFFPTFLAGIYYYKIATPLYATKSEFLIQKADGLGGAASLAGMFGGTAMAASQDSIAVQSYLQSRDAMLRLDREKGYKAHFSQPTIDGLERLDPNASNEALYKLYRRNVKIGYDPTEGIIKMEVTAADPKSSEDFSKALLSFAEQQVDHLTQRVREDQMKGARETYNDAETKIAAAQDKVLKLQEQLGVLDPKSETALVMEQVAQIEVMLGKKRLELNQLQANAKPSEARVKGVQGDMARLQEQLDGLRASMTVGEAGNKSLAEVTGELRIAEAELQTRQLMLGQTIQQLETARIEANRQVRYLSTSVAPVAPDEPTYPRSFENTALAFLVFAGIYLMLSLTASILREQMTS